MMWGVPSLIPAPLTSLQRREERIARIVKAMRDAPQGFTLMEWIFLSEESMRREYAKCIEPLLAAHEEEGDESTS